MGGLDSTSSGGETPTNSPSLSKSSRVREKGPRAVQLGEGKAMGGVGGGGGGVRFDPSLDASLSLSLSGGNEEEPMMIGEDEPGECVSSLTTMDENFVCLNSPSNLMFSSTRLYH